MATEADHNGTPREPKAPVIIKVPHKSRHTQALLRKKTIRPLVKRRRNKRDKSRRDIKMAINKPSSGRSSPRPKRGASKRTKLERYTHA